MPLFDYKLSMLPRKLLGSGEFLDLESLRLAQFHTFLHVEDCLTSTPPHMDVNRPMLITVEEEPVALLLEDPNRYRSMTRTCRFLLAAVLSWVTLLCLRI